MSFTRIARWFAVMAVLAGVLGFAFGLWIGADPTGVAQTFNRPVESGANLREESFMILAIGLALGVLSEISSALRQPRPSEKVED